MERTKNLCYYVDTKGNLAKEPLQDMKTVYVDLIQDLKYNLVNDKSDFFTGINGTGGYLPFEEYVDSFYFPAHFHNYIEDDVKRYREEGKMTNLKVIFRRVIYKSTMQHYPRLIRNTFNDGYGLYIKEKEKEICEHPESVPSGQTTDINILYLPWNDSDH